MLLTEDLNECKLEFALAQLKHDPDNKQLRRYARNKWRILDGRIERRAIEGETRN